MLSIDKINKLEKENEELKAENERLKEEILKWQKAYSRQYQINENKGYNKKEEQYRQTLQEIKEIAERCNLCEECSGIDDCERECGDAAEPCSTYQMQIILNKITKAESEG